MTGPDPALPLAVHVAFAGVRRLLGNSALADADEAAVRDRLRTQLESLGLELGLQRAHFLVGVSSLAIGADTLFSEAAQQLRWPQRVLLPEPRDRFLTAQGASEPDFSPEQRLRAERLFDSPHVIEETVVSTAAERVQRFEDTNLRLLEEADVLVCLTHDDTHAQAGGTRHLLQLAAARGVPALELTLRCAANGVPTIDRTWHRLQAFVAPAVPPILASPDPDPGMRPDALPSSSAYAQRVKNAGTRRAGQRRESFRLAAAVIVGTHAAATLLAVLAMKLPHEWHGTVLALLAVELVLLATGWLVHWRLHHGKSTWHWAMTRLCAELGRSALAVDGLPLSLGHLLALPLPQELRPLLRTMNVLHLRSVRLQRGGAWPVPRERYLHQRLRSAESGQVDYYGREAKRARATLSLAQSCFWTMSGFAFAATLIKLLATAFGGDVNPDAWISLAGVLAVWLPVMAVGAMSLAAAYDAEGRAHTFDEMRRFVDAHARRVEHASSLRELAGLVAQVEARLVSEALTWFARRAYAGVA